jgi:hypothetical protein
MAIAEDWTPEKRYQRWKTVLDLRAQGKTYAAIGQQIGVSTAYVRVLLLQAKRNFYKQLDTPRYPEPQPLLMAYKYEMCMLYQLKDFLEEVADGKC